MTTDLLCDNCAYECDEVNEETGYCQTCQRAFSIGYRVGRQEKESEDVCEEEGECDKCGDAYELADRTSRCGDCGNCGSCCEHREVASV